jgi:hypothetical protein
MDQVRALTSRRVPLKTKELIEELNPVLRGWGHHYKRAHVRKLFHRLDGWIVRRIWSHRFKRWRHGGWRQLPGTKLYGEYGLVNLIQLIPSIASRKHESSRKLYAGKPHVQFERRTVASVRATLCASSDPTAEKRGNARVTKIPELVSQEFFGGYLHSQGADDS